MVILDTNIIIDHIRQGANRQSLLDKIIGRFPVIQLAISIISVQELFTGVSTREPKARELLLSIIEQLQILPFNFKEAQLGGEILRDIKPNMSFADAAIAATAILNKAELFTLNKKDFKEIKNLKVI